MDVSVTDANLKNAAVQFGCKFATHCNVFVQWSLAKPQQALRDWVQIEGKGEGLEPATHATELSVDRPGFSAKWSLLWELPAVTYPR